MKQNNLFGFNDDSPEEINISKCMTFQRCPFEYKLRYIDKQKSKWRQNLKMNLGILLHDLVSMQYKKILAHENVQTTDRLIENIWEKEKIKYGIYEKEYYNKLKSALNRFNESPVSKIIPIASEYRFDNLLGSNLRLSGRIDFIGKDNNDLQIWDFKLEESEIFSSNVEYEKYFQLIFYYYGVKDTFGTFANRLGYYIFSNGKTITTKLTPELLENGLLKIERTIKEMREANIFIPNINNYCSSCGYKYICPAHINKSKGGCICL